MFDVDRALHLRHDAIVFIFLLDTETLSTHVPLAKIGLVDDASAFPKLEK